MITTPVNNRSSHLGFSGTGSAVLWYPLEIAAIILWSKRVGERRRERGGKVSPFPERNAYDQSHLESYTIPLTFFVPRDSYPRSTTRPTLALRGDGFGVTTRDEKLRDIVPIAREAPHRKGDKSMEFCCAERVSKLTFTQKAGETQRLLKITTHNVLDTPI